MFQILGALCGSATIGAIRGGYDVTGANVAEAGYLANSSEGIRYLCAFVMEFVLTLLFVLAVLGVTADNKFSQVGGLVIGFALCGAHLVGDGITNTSVNPARSLSVAVFAAIGGNMTGLSEILDFLISPARRWRSCCLPLEDIPKQENSQRCLILPFSFMTPLSHGFSFCQKRWDENKSFLHFAFSIIQNKMRILTFVSMKS